MTSFLQIENLTKSVGDRLLFADVTFGVNEGDKIGVIAKNGTGKTTLLRCIAGKDSADSGSITFHNDINVGILEQTPYLPEELTVIEACLTDNTHSASVIARYEKALASGDGKELEKAIHDMDAADAWDYEDRLKQLLFQLKITDMNQRIGTLSGGQRKRVSLARVILENPDLIILDEPTNHFDPETQKIIGENLRDYSGTIIMVSHNPAFVEQIGITRMLIVPPRQDSASQPQKSTSGSNSRMAIIKNYSPELLEYYYYLNSELI